MDVYDYDNLTNNTVTIGSITIPPYGNYVSNGSSVPELDAYNDGKTISVYKNGSKISPNYLTSNILNTWIGFGDSIMYNNGGPNIGNGKLIYDKSWMTWANAQLGGRLVCTRNAGVSGDTTAMMLARIEIDVTPYVGSARFCIFNGGINDPLGGSGGAPAILTFAQSKTNLIAIIARLRQLFSTVIWCSPTPYAPDATTAAKVSQLARWVRDYAQTLSGVIFIDNYGSLVDPLATTGNMNAGLSNDNPMLHPNCKGARPIAVPLVNTFTSLLSASPALPVTQHNTFANIGALATQVLPNPLMVTNGGTITGTNTVSAGTAGLAGAPLGYTVRAGTSGNYGDGTTGITCQLVTKADGRGNALQLVQTAGANAGTPIIEVLTADYSANVSAGQTIQGVFTLSMSGAANIKKIVLYLSITDSSGAQTYTALTNDGADFSQADFLGYVFKSTPYLLVGTVTGLRLRADIYGIDKTAAATFKLEGSIDILQTQ